MILLCTISLFYNSNFVLVELDTHKPVIEDVFKEDGEGGRWKEVKEIIRGNFNSKWAS